LSEKQQDEEVGAEKKVQGFTERLTERWGEEETELRTAIFISFV
jgi:hypothetical protein